MRSVNHAVALQDPSKNNTLDQIFGHLRPYDLLRLARTTKALRDILMRRSAISIWKDARASIAGFPETPDDMDEPQYAHLAFEPFCTVSCQHFGPMCLNLPTIL